MSACPVQRCCVLCYSSPSCAALCSCVVLCCAQHFQHLRVRRASTPHAPHASLIPILIVRLSIWCSRQLLEESEQKERAAGEGGGGGGEPGTSSDDIIVDGKKVGMVCKWPAGVHVEVEGGGSHRTHTPQAGAGEAGAPTVHGDAHARTNTHTHTHAHTRTHAHLPPPSQMLTAAERKANRARGEKRLQKKVTQVVEQIVVKYRCVSASAMVGAQRPCLCACATGVACRRC